MAVQQLAQSKAKVPAVDPSIRMPAVSGRSAAGPFGAGYLETSHNFGNIPLFAGTLEAGAPTDAQAGIPFGATIDAGATTDGGSPDAGAGGGGAQDGGSADAGNGSATQPVAACTITSKTAVHAPDRTPDTRTTIGVCETVQFEVGGQVADWSVSNGWPASGTGRVRFDWAAPELPGTSTITARVPATGQTCSIDMNVIAPKTIRMDNTVMLPTTIPSGFAGGLARATMHIGPSNVNFGWIGIKEDKGPATNVTGFFTKFKLDDLRHDPSTSLSFIDFANTTHDKIGLNVPMPGPFKLGTWDWEIPTRYQCRNSSGAGHLFAHTTERFRMNPAGVLHVTKAGAGF